MMATGAAAVTVDQSTVLAGCRRLGTVTETRFAQANHHGGQRQEGGQRAQRHQDGVDDDGALF